MRSEIQEALEAATGRQFDNHPKDYIGDGVYAFFDGITLYLCTMREHGNVLHWLSIEPGEMAALQKFLVRGREEINERVKSALQPEDT